MAACPSGQVLDVGAERVARRPVCTVSVPPSAASDDACRRRCRPRRCRRRRRPSCVSAPAPPSRMLLPRVAGEVSLSSLPVPRVEARAGERAGSRHLCRRARRSRRRCRVSDRFGGRRSRVVALSTMRTCRRRARRAIGIVADAPPRTLSPALPVSTLSSAVPVPLMAGGPVSVRFSTVAATPWRSSWTVSVPSPVGVPVDDVARRCRRRRCRCPSRPSSCRRRRRRRACWRRRCR